MPRDDIQSLMLQALAAQVGECALPEGVFSKSSPRWREWLEALGGERLAPLAGHWCKGDTESGMGIPEESRRRLAQIYYATTARNFRLLQAAAEVIESLRQAGVPVIVLKGAHLAETVYPTPGCRPLGDIDLLVAPQDYAASAGVLRQAGYHPLSGASLPAPPPVTAALNSVMWRHSHIGDALHLHWHLLNSGQPFGLPSTVCSQQLWAAAQPFTLAGCQARGLAPHHLLIHLTEHALRHGYSRLVLLADLAFTLRHYAEGIDWRLLLEEARRFRLLSSLAVGLLLTRRHAATALPPAIVEELARTPLTWPERKLLEQYARYRGRFLWTYFIYWSHCSTVQERTRFLRMSLRPESSRLALQGGHPRWSGYVAGLSRRLFSARRVE